MIWMSDSGITFSILPHLDTYCSIPPHCQPLSQAGSSPNRLQPLARQLAKQKACEGGRDTGRALDVARVREHEPMASLPASPEPTAQGPFVQICGRKEHRHAGDVLVEVCTP